ncbi:PDR/VanB family oxidoreductase [Azohydromonas lata]|uniref:PDR/VanB family oxidoreductase n=1 Tax=Azohydromonas lata TaxID=45677 RepID=A0ABU5ICZ4_9BURK|nr:PDR/VanB family oxidoreductase [Azohydromonas lata]MDZ5456848.1 PDR/VanB family oxidoreductase [Azohydromonas lata]
MTVIQTHADTQMPLRIARITDAAEGIRSFELVQHDGSELPPFTPGSHVKVQVPNGLLRKYSLCNDPAERHRYVITVKRDAQGQGGSMSLCDEAREGDTLPTSLPDNAFPLFEDAKRHIFIAGGIGITPILSMIRSFGELPPAPWKLYYLTRSAESTAFLDELNAPELKGKVVIHHDHGDPANSLDLWPVLERPAPGAHIYCCGPRGLMDAVRDMAGHWPSKNVHFESFNEGGGMHPDDKPFTVTVAKTGQHFEVPVGKTILSVLRDHGCTVPSSCESGTCGTCRTKLVSGEADHRDMVLMPEEMESQIMICVSRAKGGELVIDL